MPAGHHRSKPTPSVQLGDRLLPLLAGGRRTADELVLALMDDLGRMTVSRPQVLRWLCDHPDLVDHDGDAWCQRGRTTVDTSPLAPRPAGEAALLDRIAQLEAALVDADRDVAHARDALSEAREDLRRVQGYVVQLKAALDEGERRTAPLTVAMPTDVILAVAFAVRDHLLQRMRTGEREGASYEELVAATGQAANTLRYAIPRLAGVFAIDDSGIPFRVRLREQMVAA
jgi:hypothetical protein